MFKFVLTDWKLKHSDCTGRYCDSCVTKVLGLKRDSKQCPDCTLPVSSAAQDDRYPEWNKVRLADK